MWRTFFCRCVVEWSISVWIIRCSGSWRQRPRQTCAPQVAALHRVTLCYEIALLWRQCPVTVPGRMESRQLGHDLLHAARICWPHHLRGYANFGDGEGFLDTPGIHTDDQVAAWSKIVRAAHEIRGRMFLQLWYVGRISHTSLLPGGASLKAPSAIRAAGCASRRTRGIRRRRAPRRWWLAHRSIPQIRIERASGRVRKIIQAARALLARSD